MLQPIRNSTADRWIPQEDPSFLGFGIWVFLGIWVLGFGFSPVGASGPDEGDGVKSRRRIPLSLRQSLHLALNHNLDIEVARFQPWIEEQNLETALGSFDHVAYLSVGGGESVSSTFSSLAGASELDNDSFQFALGVRRTLPIGATFDLFYQGDRLLTNNAFSTLNPSWSEALGISLTVPVLRNAGIDSTCSSVLVARNARDGSVHDFERSLTESLYLVEQAYWNLVLAAETKKVREQSLEVARRLAEDRRQMFEGGLLAKVDVTQAQAQVAAQEEGILTAENDLEDALDRLKRLVDPSLLADGRTELAPVDRPLSPETPLDEEAATQRSMEGALARRPDYRSLRKKIESQGALVDKYDRDSLPRLDLTGRAALTGVDSNLGNTFGEVLDGDTHDLTIGLTLEVPIGNGAARGRLRAAELERRRLQLQGANLEHQILVEVREAVRDIKTAEKRVLATRGALRLAQEQFDGEWKRRAEGLRTTFHVLDAQENLAEARTNEIKARVDYTLALENLKRVSGTLLESYDIRLADNLHPRQS